MSFATLVQAGQAKGLLIEAFDGAALEKRGKMVYCRFCR